jgi:hypothetical protein
VSLSKQQHCVPKTRAKNVKKRVGKSLFAKKHVTNKGERAVWTGQNAWRSPHTAAPHAPPRRRTRDRWKGSWTRRRSRSCGRASSRTSRASPSPGCCPGRSTSSRGGRSTRAARRGGTLASFVITPTQRAAKPCLFVALLWLFASLSRQRTTQSSPPASLQPLWAPAPGVTRYTPPAIPQSDPTSFGFLMRLEHF